MQDNMDKKENIHIKSIITIFYEELFKRKGFYYLYIPSLIAIIYIVLNGYGIPAKVISLNGVVNVFSMVVFYKTLIYIPIVTLILIFIIGCIKDELNIFHYIVIAIAFSLMCLYKYNSDNKAHIAGIIWAILFSIMVVDYIFNQVIIRKYYNKIRIYISYLIKSFFVLSIIFLILLFSFPFYKYWILMAYSYSTGYPRLLIDNKKTYYLPYQDDNFYYAYELNCSKQDGNDIYEFIYNERVLGKQQFIYKIDDKNIKVLSLDSSKLCKITSRK